MIKLGAQELRAFEPTLEDLRKIKRNPIYIILDNVLDTYNVGAIFRLADAVAAEKIFLCGETETPPNPKIKKASVGTWKWIPWEYCQTTREAINGLRSEGGKWEASAIQIVALEQHPKSIPYNKAKYEFPLAVVVGNESFGIAKEVLKMVDLIVEIPMFGVNKSLNVVVSGGVVLFKIMEQLNTCLSMPLGVNFRK